MLYLCLVSFFFVGCLFLVCSLTCISMFVYCNIVCNKKNWIEYIVVMRLIILQYIPQFEIAEIVSYSSVLKTTDIKLTISDSTGLLLHCVALVLLHASHIN